MFYINKINTFEDLIEARKQKEKLINEIQSEFVKNYNIATINLTKDLLLNVIPNKINALIEQLKNPIVLEAEKEKLNKLENIRKDIIELRKEQRSILSIVTSNLKFKKSVSHIEEVSSTVLSNEKYVANVGENGSSFQQVLEGSDIEFAKRFVELSKLIVNLNKEESLVYKDFDNKIKDIKYISDDFDQELEELRNVSKVNWYSISNFDENEYYLFYGNEDDYDVYFNQIVKIKELYKQFNSFKEEILNWEID